MDHEILDEFFSNNMLIDLNNELCITKQDDMFDWEILDNYAAQILDAKYKQVNTNGVAADQKHLNVNQPQVSTPPGKKHKIIWWIS